ncbi:MAG: hypothetical protein JWO38_5416 [Gemmataceae bacterium]|nr:hypothetical protein [Gemmataceae bacterium]
MTNGQTSGGPGLPATPDEVNRLWQHGMHEERLFHDRLNYFSFLETGLLSLCAIMYNKEPAIGFFLPLTVVALLFTLLWLVIQMRHWEYCVHVNDRIRRIVPEYRATVETFAGPGRTDGLSISKPLALSVPVLFAGTWVAFFVWLLVRAGGVSPPETDLTPERAVLVILAAAVAWLAVRLRRVERLLHRNVDSRSEDDRPGAASDRPPLRE